MTVVDKLSQSQTTATSRDEYRILFAVVFHLQRRVTVVTRTLVTSRSVAFVSPPSPLDARSNNEIAHREYVCRPAATTSSVLQLDIFHLVYLRGAQRNGGFVRSDDLTAV